MCDVNVSICMCPFVDREHCLDCSDDVDSEGEVDKWLRYVSGHWSVEGGWMTRMDGQGRVRSCWVMYGSVYLQRGDMWCGSRNIISPLEKRILM